MPHIVVNDEQANVISQTDERIEILDSRGRRLGYVIQAFTDEDIAIAQQRMASSEPRRTTKEVLDRLQSLGQ